MDQNQGQGGSYTVGEDGVRTLIESTQDHPEGNRPRAAEAQPAQPQRAANRKPQPATDKGAK